MKKFLIPFLLLILGTAITTFAQTSSKNIQIKKEFMLFENEKGLLKSRKILIEFVSVTEDSRCPVDVSCVWAGNAKIQIKVSKGKSAAKIFDLNTNLEPKIITFQGLEIELIELSPTLKSDDDRTKIKYAAKFVIKN